MKTRSISHPAAKGLNPLIPLLFALIVPIAAGQTQDMLTNQPVDEVPFKLRHGHFIVLRGSLGDFDRKLNLLIDTGATDTFVNRKLARRAGLRKLPHKGINSGAFGSAIAVERVVLERLRLGCRVISRSCLSADLPWSDIDIVVGLDILRQTSLTIDYERSKVVFGGRSVSQASASLENEEGLLVVPVTLDDLTVRLAVDTGAHLTAVYRKSVNSWGKRAIGEKRVKVAHSGGFVTARQITLRSMEIGGRRISRPSLAILETENSSTKIDGVLAIVGLKRIHFDFERHILSVQ